jgi:hypothetical protein
MSKLIEATCQNGVVTADGVPVPAADILSEGVGSSEGVLLLDGEQAKYLAKISPDLKTTLDKLITALEKIASALSAIDGVGSLITTCGAGPGSATWIPVATADIAAINTAKSQLQTLKGALK